MARYAKALKTSSFFLLLCTIMLSLKFVREHADVVKDSIARRKEDTSIVDEVLRLDEAWREKKKAIDALRHERNKVSEEINTLKKAGKDASAVLARAKQIPKELKALQEEERAAWEAVVEALRKIPNVMHEKVPYGKSDEDNVELKRWGAHREFSFPVRNHVELCEMNGWADFDASARTSGNGFYFLKGDLALLNQALIRFGVTFMQKKGYLYIEPPLMLHRHIILAAGDEDAFAQSIYATDDGDLCLIGTAEHAILGLHEGQVLPEERLPLKYFGYSMCFRKEIGSHGINEKGLWRTHQFNKVEQFVFCTPEQSWQLFDELLQNSEEILQALGLPYRVVEMCTGDLAVWKARSFDVEVWRPTTKGFGEVMSLSNCTTYQAEDLGIKILRKDGTRETVHTLNNTALATSRVMVAILENFQNEDGSVTIPEALRPYMNGKKVLEKHA
ncbi:serine--tRNA ligase [Candidatus Woesearchaeota archaeon]|nr:MAG: serine--tRNA ligase [Candidatus Woesearchaeota archaeon]